LDDLPAANSNLRKSADQVNRASFRIFSAYRTHNFLRCRIRVLLKIVLALGASIKAQ
jgi:hypothetical protein